MSNLNEVAPPGWGHTKAEKEKTKPDKPKSKIGGTAAAFKRCGSERAGKRQGWTLSGKDRGVERK